VEENVRDTEVTWTVTLLIVERIDWLKSKQSIQQEIKAKLSRYLVASVLQFAMRLKGKLPCGRNRRLKAYSTSSRY